MRTLHGQLWDGPAAVAQDMCLVLPRQSCCAVTHMCCGLHATADYALTQQCLCACVADRQEHVHDGLPVAYLSVPGFLHLPLLIRQQAGMRVEAAISKERRAVLWSRQHFVGDSVEA